MNVWNHELKLSESMYWIVERFPSRWAALCVCESVGKKVSAANLILVILSIFPLLLLCSFLQRNHSKRTYSFIECCLFDRQIWWLHHISNIHQVYKEYGVSVSRGIRQHFTNEMIANETSKHTHTAPQIVYSADIQLKLVNSNWFVNFFFFAILCVFETRHRSEFKSNNIFYFWDWLDLSRRWFDKFYENVSENSSRIMKQIELYWNGKTTRTNERQHLFISRECLSFGWCLADWLQPMNIPAVVWYSWLANDSYISMILKKIWLATWRNLDIYDFLVDAIF